MGLDMYLHRKTYVGNKWRKPEEQLKIVPAEKGKEIKQERVSEVVEEVGYWRKANAIHNWFINNCNNGDDDNCKEILVSKDDLQNLLVLVNKVLEASELIDAKVHNGDRGTPNGWEPIMEDGKVIKDPTVAMELLPTTSGFFFGSTDYDQYYIQDLLDTKKIIETVLAEDSDGDLYYEASW